MTVPVIEGYTTVEGYPVDLVLVKPADVAAGDLLMLFCMNDYPNNEIQWTDNVTGWIFLGEVGDGTRDCHLGVYYRIANGEEPATTTVTASNEAKMVGFYLRISGANAESPINQEYWWQAGPASYVIIAQVTTDVDDCLGLIAVSFDGDDGDPFTVSTNGWTKVAEEDRAGDGSSGVIGQKSIASAGGSGSARVDFSSSDGSVYCMLAIAPVAESEKGQFPKSGGIGQLITDGTI